MKNIALYVRVSTEEQRNHGLSVDNQIQALSQYCEDNGYTIAGIYNDAGISAAKSYKKRPALLRLIEDCKKGKIDEIIFTRIDRWFRNVADYYEVQRQLDECQVPWRAIWEDYQICDSAGKFKVNIMLSIAEAEASRTSEKIKSVFAYKKEKGDYVGKAPLGYIIKDGALVKDDKVRKGIEVFFAEYLKTFSTAKALQAAYASGYSFSRSTMKTAIKNPAYSGTCTNGYECEPYITKDEYERILEFKERHTRETKHDEVFLFTKLAYCGKCGRKLAPRRKYFYLKTGEKHYYIIYVCEHTNDYYKPCEHLCINQDRIEKYLLRELDALIDVEIERVKLQKKEASTSPKVQKVKLEAKLKRLADLYADGDIELDVYRGKRDAIKKEIASLNIMEAETAPVQLPDQWQNVYNELTDENKQAFWLRIINKIIITNETKDNPQIVFNFPFADR